MAAENLGEHLAGDTIENSPYEVRARVCLTANCHFHVCVELLACSYLCVAVCGCQYIT
jgi:hypothetical protein